MDKQSFNFNSHQTIRTVLAFIVIVAMIVTVVPFIGGGENGISGSNGVYAATSSKMVHAAFEQNGQNASAEITINNSEPGKLNITDISISGTGITTKGSVEINHAGSPQIYKEDNLSTGFKKLNVSQKSFFLNKGEYSIVIKIDQPGYVGNATVSYTYTTERMNEKISTSASISNPRIGQYSEREGSNYERNKTASTLIQYYGSNNSYIGNFTGVGSDNDFYRIELNHRAPLTINATGIKAGGDGSNEAAYTLELLNESGTVVARPTVGEKGLAQIIQTDLLEKGVYYIKFSCSTAQSAWNYRYSFYVENRAKLSSASVGLYKSRIYTGKKLPFITGITYKNKKLVEGTDYKVTYSKGNTDVGKGKMTITGINGFYDKLTYDYVIRPSSSITRKKVSGTKAKIGKRKLTIKWKKITGMTHYQVKYRVKGAKKWKNKTVASNKTSLTIKKLKIGKKYQYKIRGLQKLSGQTTYYTKYSKTRTSSKIK